MCVPEPMLPTSVASHVSVMWIFSKVRYVREGELIVPMPPGGKLC